MSPTGIAFALFLPTVLLFYWAFPRRAAAQNAVLLAASYVFYASWSVEWLPLLLAGTLIDFTVARLLEDDRRSSATRRLLLGVSLATNLGALFWLKYRDFFVSSLALLLPSLEVARPALSLALPIGLSYYTLIRIGYVLDVHHRRVPAARSLLTFATFVAFFPQLVAGPFTRARQMLPQLDAPRYLTAASVASGAGALLLGWFMKGYLADWISPALVEPVFSAPGTQGALAHWMALVGFAIQVFCDFAGYSLLAIGTARFFAIELPANFDRPFVSRSMPEFWRRWHISLNAWLFDFIYGPLVTGRSPLHGRMATGLVVVFVLSGLWHGASGNFVLWGLLQGLALAAHHWWDTWYRGRCRVDKRWVTARRTLAYSLGAWVLTQGWFLTSLILFRASDLGAARDFVAGLAGRGEGFAAGFDEPVALNLAVAVAFLIWHHAEGTPRGSSLRARFDALPSVVRGVAYGCVIAWLLVFAPIARGTFIYAQF